MIYSPLAGVRLHPCEILLTVLCKNLLTGSCKKVLTDPCKKVLTVRCKKLLTMWWQNHLTAHSLANGIRRHTFNNAIRRLRKNAYAIPLRSCDIKDLTASNGTISGRACSITSLMFGLSTKMRSYDRIFVDKPNATCII